MKKNHILISLVGLLLSFMMISIGGFLFLIRFFPSVQLVVRSLVLRHLTGLSTFGFILFSTGVLFSVSLARLTKRRYILLKMGGVSIEDRVLAHFAEENLQKFFPGQQVACDVLARARGKIEIMANIPHVDDDRKEQILSEIERVLVMTLKKQCQYDKEFIFNVSFANEKELIAQKEAINAFSS